ncbi:MAG: serine/threonine protein kinase [Verrucomicrobiales bacterium]|nr:serine/threonine protein kinase [Verrucomicrobiales bacterium]
MSSTPSSALSGDGSKPPPPPRVPDHELLRRIGRGAYGEVWLARSVTGAFRAVKTVHRGSFDHDRPFEREFEGIQKFEPISRRHESQVDILHVGRGDDCFYYVMELADDQASGGQIHPDSYAPRSLKSDLQFHGRLPFEECVRIGIALTTALQNLHENGLVHRDVKPSNIIFVNGVAKLADIGLVTGVDATRSHVGTEGFAAPEGAGTPQADLYSLGKVLYEAATGKDRQEFPELPTRLREMPDREGLEELNAVTTKACRHDPKQRYATAAAMRGDLELLQSGRSLARLHRAESRLRVVQRAGVIVTVLAGLIAGGWFWQARQTSLVRNLAAEKTSLATEKSRLAEENRQRLVRLNVANGIREMDQGDFASSLVWLSEGLALATNTPDEAAVQAMRINFLLDRHPRLLHVLPHPGSVFSAEFSPDETRVVTACADGAVRIWDLAQDYQPSVEFLQDGPVGGARLTHDGRRLFVVQWDSFNQPDRALLLDAGTGQPLFPAITGMTAVALSPDDRWLAVARTNGVVEVVAVDTGRRVAEAVGHTDRVEMVGFSPDSIQLLTAGRDQTVRRWEVGTGKPLGSPLEQPQGICRAVFNRDASRIASATAAQGKGTAIQLQTWDPAVSTPLEQAIPGIEFCSALSFDRSGRYLVTADGSGLVRVWNADTHAAAAPPVTIGSPVRGVDFSPDGKLVAVGSEAGNVHVFELETGYPAFPPLHHSARTESVRFNGDGSLLLTASDDGTVKVWDMMPLPDDSRFRSQAFDMAGSAVSPDGHHLLTGVLDVPPSLLLVRLDPTALTPIPIPAANALYPDNLTFDRRGGQWALTPDPSGFEELSPPETGVPSAAGLWRCEANRIRHFVLSHDDRVRGVFFHEDGSQVLTVGDDRMTRIWNTADGSLGQAIPWREGDLAWVAASPDLHTAVTLFRDREGRHFLLRDVETGRRLGPSPEDDPDINAAGFSPDGARLATAGENQCGRIWDAKSGRPLTPYLRHGGALTTIRWSPDGRRVLTCGQSPLVKVWDAGTGELALPPLTMKARPIWGARFSPDGRFIVARSEDKFVRIWDAATGEPVTPLVRHYDNVTDAFVTDTPQLVTTSAPAVVRVWNLKETACPTRDLSDYVRLLAGVSVDGSGPPRIAGAGEQAELLHSLHSRQPDLFAVPSERLQAWHRCQPEEPHTLAQVEAAIFHLERLVRLAPGDTNLADRLEQYRAALVPPRDPTTPPKLLDLSRAYTHSFEMLRYRNFADLPRGRQTLGGVEFDLRGLIQLDHRSEWTFHAGPFHPMAIVTVGQRCQRLHFLQATEGDPRIEGSIVARWIIHYADGTAREWPVVYGEQVRDWRWEPDQEPLEASQATLVWQGRVTVFHQPHMNCMRLFKSTWTNPQPDLEITRLEYRIGETAMKPLVVAITAE